MDLSAGKPGYSKHQILTLSSHHGPNLNNVLTNLMPPQSGLRGWNEGGSGR